MATIKIQAILDGPDGKTEMNCPGILLDNKIEYLSDNILTKITNENNRVVIFRRNSEYDLELTLEENKETNGSLILNKNKLTLPIKTSFLNIKEKEIEAKYSIDDIGEFVYKIKYEVE